MLDAIHLATNGKAVSSTKCNNALGDTRLVEKIAQTLGCRTQPQDAHTRWLHRKITICLKTTNRVRCLENVVCSILSL
jgi:hypothetical protein